MGLLRVAGRLTASVGFDPDRARSGPGDVRASACSAGGWRPEATRHGRVDMSAAAPRDGHSVASAGLSRRRACRRLELCRFRSGFGPFHLWRNRNSPVARAGFLARIMWMTSCPQTRLAELSSRCMDPGITRHMRPGSGACRSRMPSRLNAADIARISSPCIPRSWSRPDADRAARWRLAPVEDSAAGSSGIAAPAGSKRSPTVNAPGCGWPGWRGRDRCPRAAVDRRRSGRGWQRKNKALRLVLQVKRKGADAGRVNRFPRDQAEKDNP
jgi:hypothetical protein